MAHRGTIRPTFPTVREPPYPLLSHGIPFHESCAEFVASTLNARRVYIIASKTLSEKTQNLELLKRALGTLLAGVWIGIPNHTPSNALIPIIEDARAKSVDCIVTLGGGSISDGAKLISFGLANDVHTLEDISRLPNVDSDFSHKSDENARAPEIPVVCIPISLSGGEYSRYAGVTDAATLYKQQYTHEKMFPVMVILDPELTVGTPVKLWIASGIRAIDHCIEGYLSRDATTEGDKAAKDALLLLVKGLLKTKDDPEDLEARLQSQLGTNLSLTLLYLGIKKGCSHGIGHQLGSFGHVAHGDTSAILLPAVCKWNAHVNHQRQEDLKRLLFEDGTVAAALKNAHITNSHDLGDCLRGLFNILGAPKTLTEVGFHRDQLKALAEQSMNEVYVKSNPRPVSSPEEVLEILNMVME